MLVNARSKSPAMVDYICFFVFCIMCRAKGNATGSKEDIEQLRGWVNKKKVWAMTMLASRYERGVGVKQSDQKAIELYEMAAKGGNALAPKLCFLFFFNFFSSVFLYLYPVHVTVHVVFLFLVGEYVDTELTYM